MQHFWTHFYFVDPRCTNVTENTERKFHLQSSELSASLATLQGGGGGWLKYLQFSKLESSSFNSLTGISQVGKNNVFRGDLVSVVERKVLQKQVM